MRSGRPRRRAPPERRGSSPSSHARPCTTGARAELQHLRRVLGADADHHVLAAHLPPPLPSSRNATPPNIAFSTSPCSPASASRMRAPAPRRTPCRMIARSAHTCPHGRRVPARHRRGARLRGRRARRHRRRRLARRRLRARSGRASPRCSPTTTGSRPASRSRTPRAGWAADRPVAAVPRGRPRAVAVRARRPAGLRDADPRPPRLGPRRALPRDAGRGGLAERAGRASSSSGARSRPATSTRCCRRATTSTASARRPPRRRSRSTC